MKRIVILISGRGSNLRALLEAKLPCTVAAVISNVPEAPGLGIARSHGITTVVVDHRRYASRAEFDTALMAAIEAQRPDLVVLAGFMRILTDGFVAHYTGRLINIHPSLLPAFPGVHTHRRALEEGVRLHGCTVHFVAPQLDCGPIIVQAAVPVLDGDDEATLAQRVLEQEHRVFPAAVRWALEGRLTIRGKRVVFDRQPATSGALISPADRGTHSPEDA